MNTRNWFRLLLVASVMVPTAVFGITAVQSYEGTLKQADVHCTGTLQLIREQVDSVFRDASLVVLSANTFLKNKSADEIRHSAMVHEELAAMLALAPELSSIVVTDAEGNVINGTFAMDVRGIVADRQNFKEAQRDSKIHLSALEMGRFTHTKVISLARRRFQPDGQFHGEILAAVKQSYLESAFHAAMGDDPSETIRLANNDGTLLVYESAIKSSRDHVSNSVLNGLNHGLEPQLVHSIATPFGDSQGCFAWTREYELLVGYTISDAVIRRSWLLDILPDLLILVTGVSSVGAAGWMVLRGLDRESLIHSRLEAESEKRQSAEEKINHLQRMEAIGQLTAGVAHDFNNLLSVIGGNAELLERNVEGVQKTRAKAISAAVNRGSTLTRQMLTFARRQPIQPERRDINEELRTFIPLLISATGTSVKVIHDLAPQKAVCFIDATEFELAMLNIVSNAKQAMPNGGELRIETRIVTSETGGSDLMENRHYLLLCISDDGQGMSEEIKARAFEPFFTTRPLGVGTGLGLSQVYGFARQAGGDAKIDSELGRGTKVSIFLPIVEDAPSKSDQATNSTKKGNRILVVDDTPDILDVVTESLRDNGYEVYRSEDAASALEKLKETEIDLLLTDIVMPGSMSGVELAEYAQQRDRRLRVVLMTGYSEQTGQGRLTVLRKPFRLTDLLRIVNEAFEKPPGRWD